MVTDIYEGVGDSALREFVNINGTLYFTATEGESNHQRKLWKSDGIKTGTVRLAGTDSISDGFILINETIYFNAAFGFWSLQITP
ncbi:MAG: hypothetical protein V3U75_03465 [Methylococcaceae bacterium]